MRTGTTEEYLRRAVVGRSLPMARQSAAPTDRNREHALWRQVNLMDTILIVDDSSFIVDGLVAILKKKYRPLAAYSGEEGLLILRKEIPSIIILDIMMEPMDGWETLSRIKENPATRHVPVLMYSARKISQEEAEKHQIGLDDFIQKPISPQKIIESIEKVLSRRDAIRQVTEVWKAAGASQEKIHEYLALTTSLEVDLSLYQNMKIQFDLASPQDRNLPEFQTVIAAVQQRIGEERSLIGTLELEMNDLRGAGGDPEKGPESVAPERVFLQEPLENPPVTTGNPGSPVAPAVMIADEIPPVPPEEVRGVPGIPLLEDELFEELPGTPLEDGSFAEPPGTSGPGHMASPENNETESPTIQESGVKLPVLPDVHPAKTGPLMGVEEPPALTRYIPPVPTDRVPGTAGNDRTGTRGASLEYLGPPCSPDIIPRYEELSENRHLIPADPDIPPAMSDEPPVGAGTDVPMARYRSQSTKKPPDRRSPETGDPLRQPATGSRPGRVARLMATLFARKKK
jgi:two-component system OmpR family response regulator